MHHFIKSRRFDLSRRKRIKTEPSSPKQSLPYYLTKSVPKSIKEEPRESAVQANLFDSSPQRSLNQLQMSQMEGSNDLSKSPGRRNHKTFYPLSTVNISCLSVDQIRKEKLRVARNKKKVYNKLIQRDIKNNLKRKNEIDNAVNNLISLMQARSLKLSAQTDQALKLQQEKIGDFSKFEKINNEKVRQYLVQRSQQGGSLREKWVYRSMAIDLKRLEEDYRVKLRSRNDRARNFGILFGASFNTTKDINEDKDEVVDVVEEQKEDKLTKFTKSMNIMKKRPTSKKQLSKANSHAKSQVSEHRNASVGGSEPKTRKKVTVGSFFQESEIRLLKGFERPGRMRSHRRDKNVWEKSADPALKGVDEHYPHLVKRTNLRRSERYRTNSSGIDINAELEYGSLGDWNGLKKASNPDNNNFFRKLKSKKSERIRHNRLRNSLKQKENQEEGPGGPKIGLIGSATKLGLSEKNKKRSKKKLTRSDLLANLDVYRAKYQLNSPKRGKKGKKKSVLPKLQGKSFKSKSKGKKGHKASLNATRSSNFWKTGNFKTSKGGKFWGANYKKKDTNDRFDEHELTWFMTERQQEQSAT